MELNSNEGGTKAVGFNVNIFVTGVLIASVLSALGFSDGDPVIQWYLPGGVLLLSLAVAVLRPPKRKVRKPRGVEG